MLNRYYILIGLLIGIGIIAFASSYTAPPMNSINISLCSPYVAPSMNSINITLGVSDACSSSNVTNSCTYSGAGSWAINATDNCNITSTVLVYGNVTCWGTGNLTITNQGWLKFNQSTFNLNLIKSPTVCTLKKITGGNISK